VTCKITATVILNFPTSEYQSQNIYTTTAD